MAVLTDLAIALGHIASSAVKGAAKAVLGNLVMLDAVDDDEDAETSTNEPLYGPLGFYARPRAPVTDSAATPANPAGRAEFVGVRLGDRVLPLGYRDLRLSALVNPEEGEIGIVQYRGGAVILRSNVDDDGTNICLYAPRNVAGAPVGASTVQIDSTSGNQQISLMHEYGHSVALTKDGDVMLTNKLGDAYLRVGDNGITLNGNTAMKGALLDLSVGNPATAEGLMMSTAMLTWITQVNLFLGVLAPLFNAAPGPVLSGGPGTVVMPVAIPKTSTIAKASEFAV